MNENRHGRFIILDGMRGIAAIAVMVFHYTSHYDYQIFSNAPVAVDLFFILSGFVLSFSYGDKVLKKEIGFRDFLCRRIIRLYPMFIIGLLWGSIDLYFFRKLGQTTYSLHEIIASLFYNSLFLPFTNTASTHLFERPFASVGAIFPANGVSWSLFCEMFANLFFFRLIFMQKKSLVKTIIISLVLLVGLSFTANFSQYSYNLSVDTGWGTTNFLPGLARVFFGFTLGILIQKSILHIAIEDINHPFFGHRTFRFCANHPLLLYFFLIGFFLIPIQLDGLISLLSVCLLCPALVFIGAFAAAKNEIINRVSRFLGWISYPIYCLHIPVGNLMALADNEGSLHKALPLPLAVSASAATIIISIVLTRIYEEPMRAYLTKISKAWREKSVSSHPL